MTFLSIGHEYPEFFDTGGVFQFLDCLGLDLPDSLTGNRKTFTHLFKRMIILDIDSVAHYQHCCATDYVVACDTHCPSAARDDH